MLYYREIGDIKNVFFDYENPRWALYSGKGTAGFPTGRTAANNLLYRQNAELDLGASWQKLETNLLMLAKTGGYGKLFIGDESDNISVPIYLPHRGEDGNQGAAQISGYMSGMTPPWNYLDMIAKEREIWEMRQEIEGLKGAQRGGLVERIIEGMAETGQLQAVISGLAAVLLKSAGAGVPAIAQAPPAVHAPDTEGETEGTEAEHIADEFISEIRGAFSSNAEMKEYLKRTAKLFRNDPDGFKAVLKNVQ